MTDTARDLFHDESPVPEVTRWTRGAASFFQGNRYLTGALVREVLCAGGGRSRRRSLRRRRAVRSGARRARHAGHRRRRRHVGAAATSGRTRSRMTRALDSASRRRRGDGRPRPGRHDAVIVDPPRTGLSTRAIEAVDASRCAATRVRLMRSGDARAGRRDLRVKGATRCSHFEGFDLFPNTAHIECVAAFDRTRLRRDRASLNSGLTMLRPSPLARCGVPSQPPRQGR